MHDPYNLERFVIAQNPVIDDVLSELRAGRKQGHWMWFVFPQLKGLGHSSTAMKFGISSREEAAAYLQHPLLGPRLRDCTRLVNLAEGRSVEQIFGYPDDLKFRSCMTLFAEITSSDEVFKSALDKYFEGQSDPRTVARM
ncbi:MAG: DUF1810 domain-containing protein [Acidobacteriota bacterium]|nr:DUF1810 domain-containing protein [Acidobacteriota bacterium]